MIYTLLRKSNSHGSMYKIIGSTRWSLGILGSMEEKSLTLILKQRDLVASVALPQPVPW
jgi:hypothetical protein